MRPALHHPVQVVISPLDRTATVLDPVFRVPVDQASSSATAPKYGTPITTKGQVNFGSYESHRVRPEGDLPDTAGTLTILATDMPAEVDLTDAHVDSIAGAPVDLIIRELRPGGWSPGGKPSLYRARLTEAQHANR